MAQSTTPLWKQVDDRFFFNKELVKELIELNDSRYIFFVLLFLFGKRTAHLAIVHLCFGIFFSVKSLPVL